MSEQIKKTVLQDIIKKSFLKGATGDATWHYAGGKFTVLAQDAITLGQHKLAACVQVEAPGLTLPERFTITPPSSKALLRGLKAMPEAFDIAVSDDLKTMTLTSGGLERTVLLDQRPNPAKQPDRHQKALLDAYAQDIVSFHNNVVENNRLCEEAGRTAGRSAIENAIKAGEMLVGAKKTLGHGNWLNWLEANCGNISDTTAQKYMRLHDANSKQPEVFKDLPSLTHAYLACGAIKSPAGKKTSSKSPEASAPVSVPPVKEPATPPPSPIDSPSSTQTPDEPIDGVSALEQGLRDGTFTVEDAVAFVANHMKDCSPSLLKPLAEYYGMMTDPVSLTPEQEPQPMDIAA